jgi:hypothetical protein
MAEGQTQSIREMAEGEADRQPTQEELFPGGVFAGDELSLRDLIKPHHEVTASVSFRSAEFPLTGGLLDPERESMALVYFRWEKPDLVPQWKPGAKREETPPIVGWKVRQVLEPFHVERLRGEVDVIAANFEALLVADEAAAGNLLERLRDKFEKAVASDQAA